MLILELLLRFIALFVFFVSTPTIVDGIVNDNTWNSTHQLVWGLSGAVFVSLQWLV